MITSLSTAIAPSAASSTQPMSPASTSDQDGESAKSGHVRHRHGGGHMMSAISQALQSLGMTLPVSAPATGTSSASDPSDTTATPASGQVKNDLRQFMHQLFEAVKAESAASPSP